MSYAIDSRGDIVEVVLAGRLGYDIIAAMLEELDALAAEADPLRLRVLVDETDARPGLLGISEIRRWISRWKAATALKRGRIAVVAPSMVMYGLNRMAHGVSGDEAQDHLDVFRDRAAALAWLEAGPQ